MTALTTRQRDLLTVLLTAEAPLGAEDLAEEMRLTPRQVNYGLKGLRKWLALRKIELDVTPGVGVKLNCTQTQIDKLQQDISSLHHFHLILSAGERQQLLALILLVTAKPMYLLELELLAQVSRSTVSKDLDTLENWVANRGMALIRRPNFGVEVVGTENLRQELIAILLWGETPFGHSLFQINHTHGLVFSLQPDADLHPLVQKSVEIVDRWNLGRVFNQVAYAEVQLGGRFTDDAVLHLALIFSILTDRITQGQYLQVDPDHIQSLKKLPVWDVAKMIAMRLGWQMTSTQRDANLAGMAIWLLAAPRNERWPGDLDLEACFNGLIPELLDEISLYYETPEMRQDRILHDGLVNDIIPACLRQKYQIWSPPLHPNYSLSDKYAYEYKIAQRLVEIIQQRTTFLLPDTDTSNIATLLRAARIRIRPYRLRQVLVVCPSGMASAQLLVARLEARFPRLGPLNVVSVRELTPETIAPAELIVTTIPLPADIRAQIDVIQVHPLLLPEDVEAITQYLT